MDCNQALRAWYETLSPYLLAWVSERKDRKTFCLLEGTKGISDIIYILKVNLNWALDILRITFLLCPYTDSDYARASLDRKSTTGGCQFLECRLISWQCKKADSWLLISTLKAEYKALPLMWTSGLWNKFNCLIMEDSIREEAFSDYQIDHKSEYSDLLTKAFDVSRFQYLIAKWNEKAAKDELGLQLVSSEIKTVNNETQIHTKVEGKTIVISESCVRKDLQFDNEDEVNAVYDTPSHTKKIFANMRRQGKDFSGTVTPLFSSMLAQQADMGEGSGQPTDPQHTSTSVQPSNEEPITVPSSSQPKKTHRPRKAKRATKISQSNEAVDKELGDNLMRAATTASSLEAEQDSGSGPRCQDTILGDAEAQTRFETASKQSNNPPLSRVNTLRSGEDRLKLKELMDLCTKLSDRVFDSETTKTAQAKEIASLKKRVKKLERKRKLKTPRMNLFKIDKDFNEEFDANMDEAIEQVYDANNDIIKEGEVQVPTADMEVNTASALYSSNNNNIEDEDLIIAQTLMKMRSEKSKVRGVVMKEPSETATRPTLPPQQHDPKDKGKAQMQAELEEEERLAREREEDVNIDEWDNAQAMMDADYELATRIQAQELRAEEQRIKPLTKAQKRNQMCTYLKNMAGFTHNQLKNKSFDEVQKAFDKTISWIDTFVPVDSEVVKGSKDRVKGGETRAEGSSKGAGEDLQQESTKKQKMDDDKEKEELKQ
ncbi:hypothetical protein Tco_0083661 [Tanacetum coccineum]